MTIFLTVTTDWWRCNTFVSGIEHPIGAERYVCTMESHGTGNIEIALIYHLAELGHECNHTFNLFGVVVDGIMKIFHAVLIAEEWKLV